MIDHQHLNSNDASMAEHDLVTHHYNRRSLWGAQTIWYRRRHPMEPRQATGTYQTWEIDTWCVVPEDAQSVHGQPVKLFYNEDVSVSVSRRQESMPYFFRNCDGDEMHVISKGRFSYETEFGVIDAQEQDVVVIPKGVTYRATVPQAGETLRLIIESVPEIFTVPAEMVEHVYHKGRPPIDPSKLQRPRRPTGEPPQGEFEVRVKYSSAFADFLGPVSTLMYDTYPLDVEIVEGAVTVFKFSLADVERLGPTPVPFLGAAYLDNPQNRAWMMHMTGGGGGPVHRNPDVDELFYNSSGAKTGHFQFAPQGVDHGAGRGYTKRERNRPPGPFDIGDRIALYSGKPLKGTQLAQTWARPSSCM